MSDIVPLGGSSSRQIKCIVTNMSKRYTITLFEDQTVKDMYDAVAKEADLDRANFSLSVDKLELTPTDEDRLMSEIAEGQSKLQVYLDRTGGELENDGGAASYNDNNNNSTSNYNNNNANVGTSNAVSWSGSSGASYSGYKQTSTSKFRGLSNQGATCYMNSLLQSLFMTPEFRAALYNWQLNSEAMESPTARAESIPFQLQKLFAGLQLSKSRALETKDLTKSFGWDSSEAFTQHDVQELCRVLFDSLENAFEETPQAKLIQDLYQGTMMDYVQCKECNHESSRTDHFLDIPLQIRAFGSTTATGSVEEGLREFIKPEVLDGDNQYFCESCKKKTDAHKGLKFTKFPYVLTLVLKRFDIDYTTMRRIKLNDRMTFPRYLDMAPYVAGTGSIARRQSDLRAEMGMVHHDSGESTGSGAGAPPQGTPTRTASVDEEDMYELFSVNIHSGSAFGGHYYAYIKSFEDGKWYRFNDSMVSELDDKDIEDAYGGTTAYSGSSYYSSFSSASSYASSSNAYMLMYRKIDRSRNLPAIPDEAVPSSLLRIMEQESAADAEEKAVAKAAHDNLSLYAHVNELDYPLQAHKDMPMPEFLEKVLEITGLQDTPRDCVRLRRHNQHFSTNQDVLTVSPDRLVRHCLSMLDDHFAVEIKKPEETFREFSPTNMTLKISVLLGMDQEFSSAHDVVLDKASTLGALRQQLSEEFDIPLDECLILKCNPSQPTVEALTQDQQRLSLNYINDGAALYCARHAGPPSSELAALVEAAASRITILFTDLDVKVHSHSVVVPVRTTLQELKELMAAKLGVPASDFRVYRDSMYNKTELVRLQESLKDNGFYVSHAYRNREKLLVESPHAVMCEFKLVMLHPERATSKPDMGKVQEDLGTANLDEAGMIKDVKVAVAARLKELVGLEVEPLHIRLREISYSNNPLKVFMDEHPFKQQYYYPRSGAQLAVQIMDKPEVKTKAENWVLEVQRWLPETMELTPRREVLVAQTMPISDFKQLLSDITGVPVEYLEATRSANYVGTPLIDIDKLKWTNLVKESSWSYSSSSDTVWYSNLIHMVESVVLYVRDKREVLKELSPEEKETLEAHAKKMRAASESTTGSSWGKEKKLKIKGGGPKAKKEGEGVVISGAGPNVEGEA
mmetsp:Transcript_25722/g.59337  ORF Transcript_25722/g.59337 Transcript_25722/m.59337 type:complete len:1137 (-) Transcript_25722:120-3530(-)